MSVNRYRLSLLAERDLDDIWLYVAQDSGSDAANRLIDDITERFVLLATHPEAGRLREEIAPNLRSFPVQNHVIYYRPDEAGILIARLAWQTRSNGHDRAALNFIRGRERGGGKRSRCYSVGAPPYVHVFAADGVWCNREPSRRRFVPDVEAGGSWPALHRRQSVHRFWSVALRVSRRR